MRVFISYSHDSPYHKERVLKLTQKLRSDDINAWIDRFECSPKEGWPRWIYNQLMDSNCVICVCTSTYKERFLGSILTSGRGATYEGYLAIQILYDEHMQNKKFIPVFFDKEDEQHIPIQLKSTSSYKLYEDYTNLIKHIKDEPDAFPISLPSTIPEAKVESEGLPSLEDKAIARELGVHSGKVPVQAIHESPVRLPGEVFAIELLTRPLVLRRDHKTERFEVIVDRRETKHALVTNAAKTEECKRSVWGRENELKEIDDEIHQFLLGHSSHDEYVVNLHQLKIPLRWASGGVMSVVTGAIKDSTEDLTPFFFRDINPWGWNFALGSGERQFEEDGHCIAPVEDELNNPTLFIIREFLEETLIIENDPIPGEILPFKQFYFDDIRVEQQKKWAERFSRKHSDRREAEDFLLFEKPKIIKNGFGRSIVNALSVFDTKTDLLVIDKDGNKHKKNNVFITINLLELGIEVIKVIKYHLDSGDHILDGELLLREDGKTELVRSPCGFIAHKALERSFSPGNYSPQYTNEIQPAFIGKPIQPNEIEFCTWDVKRRIERMQSTQASDLEKERYKIWHERFGDYFDTEGNMKPDKIPYCYIPGTAKTLSLYFQRKSE